ncbi:uncharacterized protein Dwil_GK24523, isoform A [Drosophila willistoni]|uniref:Alpha-mannosidase n=1 Tax=Drosophila willistoni TaxID=7260 RepID=B4N088_DROWI|nr:lysosomal alpha-mannosidase [Drosophila willistoni]EDW77501.1 uncharacterized protein Dwil_GK24523, isoform A [Drosophila willistoni]
MNLLGGIAVFVTLLVIKIQDSMAVCGYESCPITKDNLINIHLVPHSHNDVGWLKTADQSYYGYKNNIHHAGVQYILDNVVTELLKDSSRRFIQVETAFFSKWWKEQTATMKSAVKKLVNEGRLEFTGGAWSMNDEGSVNYQPVIDQFTHGLKFLNETFGSCARPRVGWQIDTFGHSREQASLFAQMGYDGQFFSRMDHNDKDTRLENLSMEMIWQASESLQDLELFSGLLYAFYSDTPGYGFCFDVLCNDSPIIDGNSYDNNVKSRIDEFISYASEVAEHYRTNHIMIPLGGDYQYEDAQVNFKNMDKLIKYLNERQSEGSQFNIFYSTPSCYLNSLHQSGQTWPNKAQDFFPYAHEPNSFWTGYFTSRPNQKRFERIGNHMLQTAKQLSTFAQLESEQQKKDLDFLREIMGVMQHHDAITGTERQAVSNDYDRLLHKAIVGAENNARDALRVLTNLTNGEFESCLQLNISVCAFTKDSADDVVVTLFNPLAHTSTQYVRVPVKDESYEVTNEKGTVVASEIVPVAWQVLDLEYRSNDTQHELIFKASVDKIANYYIKKVDNSAKAFDDGESKVPLRFKEINSLKNTDTFADDSSETVVKTSLIKLVIDNESGRLKNIEMNGVSENIQQNFGVYKSYESCPYTFRQNNDIEVFENNFEFTVYDGTLVKEVHQQVNEWISQVIRIYEGVNHVEFEWLVGPISTDDNLGKEVVTYFQSEIESNGVFYTDSNGREILKREKDQRESFVADLSKAPNSGNYYPVTSRIALQDENKRMALLNDRSQGGTGMDNGRLEIMLHRRHFFNDGGGVGEALNEEQFGTGLIARGQLYLMLNPVNKGATISERLTEKEIILPFWKFFSKASTATSAVPKALPSFDVLPDSVHLLTLEPFTEKEILLRVENILDVNEGNTVCFNPRLILDGLSGQEIRETTLDGNLPLTEMKRFKFTHDSSSVQSKSPEYFTASYIPLEAKSRDLIDSQICLDPMQIRTFIIKT